MREDFLPENVPEFLQKDIVTTRHEIPVASGESRTVYANYYSPSLLRWALEQWLRNVAADADPTALRRVLPIVLADSQSFHAYLRVPEAFGETYLEELAKLHEDRADLSRLKHILAPGLASRRWKLARRIGAGLLAAAALAALVLLR